MKDNTFYFPHDYNTISDYKIKRLLSKHGMQGYGIFWAIVESLYNNANALPLDYDSIAYDLRCESTAVQSVIHDFDLFTIQGDLFYSESIQRRLDERNDKSEKARNSAKKRWNDANALQSHSEGNAIKEKKGKENKENKEEYSEQSSEIILSKLLYDLMLVNNPKVKEPNFQIWAKQIDLMKRIDKRTDDEIEGAIRWSQNNDFWCSNILSTAKLRKQYDRLYLSAKKEKDKSNGKVKHDPDQIRKLAESIWNDPDLK